MSWANTAQGYGVEIWMEVHGRDTQNPPMAAAIMRATDHHNVGLCWNSNPTDVVNGSVKPSFDLLRPWIRNCHINELTSGYPYREFFSLLQKTKYERYTLCEAPESKEPERFLRYYRALWTRVAARPKPAALLLHWRRLCRGRRPHAGQPFRTRNRRRQNGARLGQSRLLLPRAGEIERPHPVDELGKTTEGRPFIAVTIAAPDTLSHLDRYIDIQQRLADPRKTTPAEAEKLIARGQDHRPDHLLHPLHRVRLHAYRRRIRLPPAHRRQAALQEPSSTTRSSSWCPRSIPMAWIS